MIHLVMQMQALENTSGTLLNVEDVQRILKVSIRTVRELTANGSLKIVKIGQSVRIRPEDLDAFIESRLVQK